MDSRLLSGTVEMLVLEVLAEANLYGYRIVRSVLERSQGTFELKEGSLYRRYIAWNVKNSSHRIGNRLTVDDASITS